MSDVDVMGPARRRFGDTSGVEDLPRTIFLSPPMGLFHQHHSRHLLQVACRELEPQVRCAAEQPPTDHEPNGTVPAASTLEITRHVRSIVVLRPCCFVVAIPPGPLLPDRRRRRLRSPPDPQHFYPPLASADVPAPSKCGPPSEAPRV